MCSKTFVRITSFQVRLDYDDYLLQEETHYKVSCGHVAIPTTVTEQHMHCGCCVVPN